MFRHSVVGVVSVFLFCQLFFLHHVGGDQLPLTLRDIPIASTTPPYYLDGSNWEASETTLGITIPATVPGDILTDLQRVDIIGDPWFENTFLSNRSLWDPNVRSWVYTTNFVLPSYLTNIPLLLVFDGVKMGAQISLNGVPLGNITNQFLRTIFSLPSNDGMNTTLEIKFYPTGALELDSRFMPCSGDWDWAPVSQLNFTDPVWGTAPLFSSGIWKSLYILSSLPITITNIVPLLRYQGTYPVDALTDGNHSGFQLNVTTYVSVPLSTNGYLTVSGEWSSNSSITTSLLALPTGESAISVTLNVSSNDIRLWWPNGLGAQPLYNISIVWSSTDTAVPNVTANRRIAFRVVALVTVNDTNATIVEESTGADGSGSFGMFFRINGAPLYARGADLVPMEEMEGRIDPLGYATVVQSAAAARMNMIRIWGGGIYPPDVFYDTCDEVGILLYHDMMFAGNGHDIASAKQPFSLSTNTTIIEEVTYQVRRLSHHPSIVLYDSANEVIVQKSGPTALYTALVIATIAKEDFSRIVWPASPAAGWISGVDRLWGTPNGNPLVPVGTGHIWDAGNERHGPYTAGVGAGNWTTVMRDPWSQAHTFDPGAPLRYLPSPGTLYGPGQPSVFASEFGTVSMSSFEAMSASLDSSSWSIHGGDKPYNCTPESGDPFSIFCTGPNAMVQRNWACDNIIWSYFGPNLLNQTGELAFKGQLFQCLIASAIHMQLDIEQRRGSNQLGTLIWQLQDIWSSGSWGTLEYGSVLSPGTIRGGRWKPAHYWLANHMFQDVMSACGYVGRGQTFVCYVSNGQSTANFTGLLNLTTIDLTMGNVNIWRTVPVYAEPGPGTLGWATFTNYTLPNVSTSLLMATLTDNVTGTVFDEHIVHLTAPENLFIPQANLTATVATNPNTDGSVNVTVSSDQVALYVTLTTMAPGRFTDNAFIVLPGTSKLVQWLPFFDPNGNNAITNLILLNNTLRIEDMSAYNNIG